MLVKLFLPNTIKNCIISRKLKPIKRPKTPPTSATRDSNEKASSSFSMMMLLLANITFRKVKLSPPYELVRGVSANCKEIAVGEIFNV